MEFKTENFRADVIAKRVITLGVSMHVAAKEIGISKATLSRIESRKSFDMETFIKVVVWLEKEPGIYFSVPRKRQDGLK